MWLKQWIQDGLVTSPDSQIFRKYFVKLNVKIILKNLLMSVIILKTLNIFQVKSLSYTQTFFKSRRSCFTTGISGFYPRPRPSVWEPCLHVTSPLKLEEVFQILCADGRKLATATKSIKSEIPSTDDWIREFWHCTVKHHVFFKGNVKLALACTNIP